MRQIASIIVSPGVDKLVHTSLRHQDWFDENDDENGKEIQGLEETHRLHKAH